MKKILLAVVAVMAMMPSAMGQGHLKFKGIPIEGKALTFEQKLVENGFQTYKSDENEIWMMGAFGGFDNCAVCIAIRGRSGKIGSVRVYFPSSDESWTTVKGEYMMIKKAYTQKYGDPDSIEKLDRPYREGDGLELTALKKGKGQYKAVFRTTIGVVTVSIATQFSSHLICAEYVDVDSLINKEQEFSDELLNDI